MIQRQLKLRLNKHQRETLTQWLWNLTGVYNWAVRKIGQDANDGVYHSKLDLQALLRAHNIGLPVHTLQATAADAWTSWNRCFHKIGKKPRLKGQRRPMNSIPFPDPIRAPQGNRVRLPLLGEMRYIKQALPEGRIKCGRIVKRASGWYLCLFIDAAPVSIPRTGFGTVGIDPGFSTLLTLSTGEKIEHPHELRVGARRLAQAQRGGNKRLTARLHERQAERRKTRNHILSRRLVSENTTIYFLRDNLRGLARSKFGKSVASAGHGQVRQMLTYKCRIGGSQYHEPENKNSTRTCCECGALTGPTGWTGLSVRLWMCGACGAHHDRDVNSARNAVRVGSERDLESGVSRIRKFMGKAA